jgi:hypothetical protein
MLFAAVTHPVEGLSLETFLTLRVEKPPDLFSGHTETNDIHNITAVGVLETVNTKLNVKILSELKCFEF